MATTYASGKITVVSGHKAGSIVSHEDYKDIDPNTLFFKVMVLRGERLENLWRGRKGAAYWKTPVLVPGKGYLVGTATPSEKNVAPCVRGWHMCYFASLGAFMTGSGEHEWRNGTSFYYCYIAEPIGYYVTNDVTGRGHLGDNAKVAAQSGRLILPIVINRHLLTDALAPSGFGPQFLFGPSFKKLLRYISNLSLKNRVKVWNKLMEAQS